MCQEHTSHSVSHILPILVTLLQSTAGISCLRLQAAPFFGSPTHTPFNSQAPACHSHRDLLVLVLHAATGCMDTEDVDALLAAGVNPRLACINGSLPLHIAAERGHLVGTCVWDTCTLLGHTLLLDLVD